MEKIKKKIITLPEMVPGTGPALMLNMLKFRDRRLYVEAYLPAFKRVMAVLGLEAKINLISGILTSVVANERDSWDAILIVEYSSAQSFLKVARSDAYREIAEPLRLAALSDLSLYMTRPFTL